MLRRHRFSGSAPEVLALHGLVGSGEDFEALHAAFPLALEAPDLHAADAASVGELAALVAGPSIVLGYSMGARVALTLAFDHPLEALILVSGTAGIADAAERAARRDADEAWARVLESDGVHAFLERWDEQPVLAGHGAIPEPWRTRFCARRVQRDPHALAHALRAWGTGSMPSLWDRLPSLATPVLLITGEGDAKFGALAGAMARQLPDAIHVAVPAAGHAVHLERPREVGAAALGYLQARGLLR
jgi:2-succinyl-6-hydroxy-2,4-cyclohexadiene-1-carboxylate synthase